MNDRFALLRVDDDEVWRVLSLDVGADRDRTKTSVAMLLTAKRAGVLGIEIYDQLVEQGAPVNLVNGLAWTFFTMGLSGPFSELLQKQGTRSKTAAANGARRSLFTGGAVGDRRPENRLLACQRTEADCRGEPSSRRADAIAW